MVRDVAPTKLMLCVSFRVPEAVAFNGREKASSDVSVAARRFHEGNRDDSAATVPGESGKRQRTE